MRLLARVLVLDDLRADLVHHLLGDLLGDLGPDVDDLVVALAVGDETFGVLLLDLRDFLRAPPSSSRFLASGIFMSSMQIEMPAFVAYVYPRVRSLSARRTVFFWPPRR